MSNKKFLTDIDNWKILGGVVLIALIFLSCLGASEDEKDKTITIIDGEGHSVDVSVPVNRIVSITSRASEIIYALGADDRIVGRDSYSFFPPSIENVPVVAESSYTPNVELIHELDPDLVIADSMLSDDDRKKIESAGIPVIVETSWDSANIAAVVSRIGILLDKEEDSGEIIAFIKKYQDIIDERTAGLKDDDKPSVFFEWSKPYRSMASGVYHNLTVEAGGINIVSDQPVQSPTMDPEWIVDRDPDIIVRSVSVTDKENLSEKLVETRNEIISRPELSDVVAIKEDHVYVLGAPILSGIRSLVGELYLAKWFHPDLFEDIDPEDVHRELLDKFFDQELEEVYVYP